MDNWHPDMLRVDTPPPAPSSVEKNADRLRAKVLTFATAAVVILVLSVIVLLGLSACGIGASSLTCLGN